MIGTGYIIGHEELIKKPYPHSEDGGSRKEVFVWEYRYKYRNGTFVISLVAREDGSYCIPGHYLEKNEKFSFYGPDILSIEDKGDIEITRKCFSQHPDPVNLKTKWVPLTEIVELELVGNSEYYECDKITQIFLEEYENNRNYFRTLGPAPQIEKAITEIREFREKIRIERIRRQYVAELKWLAEGNEIIENEYICIHDGYYTYRPMKKEMLLEEASTLAHFKPVESGKSYSFNIKREDFGGATIKHSIFPLSEE